MRFAFAPLLTALLLMSAGCSSTKYVSLREVPKNPLSAQLNLVAGGGPKPTRRTMQLLRRYALDDQLKSEPRTLLNELNKYVVDEPTAENYYAMAELAYLSAKRKEASDEKLALDLYGASVVYSYLYLFDPRFGNSRNPYDPQYRGACDLYNTALEGSLRLVQKQGILSPGCTHTIKTAEREIDVTVVARGEGWHKDGFDRFHFVSDYAVEGLTNRYETHGLGVPLIGIRKNPEGSDPREQYYPPRLTFPVTAFMRIGGYQPGAKGKPGRMQAVLELYDPLTTRDIPVADRTVPLESDLTTPLAFYLSQPEVDAVNLSTFGLLNPDQAQDVRGFYMLEPYQPEKIPVVMVHGLWSTPVTWTEMFNDLRGDAELRRHYQFWFYFYPTGQPFWLSAAQMRDDMAQLRSVLDPGRSKGALDQMVLVGHSMGGLVSKLQTIDSGDQFWKVVSDKPFDDVKASDESRQRLAKTFFFQASPSVRRVITIGTPHRGSDFANDTTRWLGRKLIMLPKMLVSSREKLIRDNPGVFRKSSLLEIDTSIDSLAPDSPYLPVLLRAQPASWVKYHNVVGQVAADSILRRVSGTSDGVVHVNSARLDDLPHVVSQVIVEADHSSVHRHPRSILEVRRVLREHLAELRTIAQQAAPPVAQYPSTSPTPVTASAPLYPNTSYPNTSDPTYPASFVTTYPTTSAPPPADYPQTAHGSPASYPTVPASGIH